MPNPEVRPTSLEIPDPQTLSKSLNASGDGGWGVLPACGHSILCQRSVLLSPPSTITMFANIPPLDLPNFLPGVKLN